MGWAVSPFLDIILHTEKYINQVGVKYTVRLYWLSWDSMGLWRMWLCLFITSWAVKVTLRVTGEDIRLNINVTIKKRTWYVSCVINNLRLLSSGMERYIILIVETWDKQICRINLFIGNVKELLKSLSDFKSYCRAHEWVAVSDAWLWCRRWLIA